MGLGADMCAWAEDNGYEVDDPYGAWVEDLQYRAFGGCCIEEVKAQEVRGLKWNQEQLKWVPAVQNGTKRNRAEEMPKKEKKVSVARTGRQTFGGCATCSECKQKKPQADFSKRQWKRITKKEKKEKKGRCVSCVNTN
jgi:hypothetical protein